MDGGWVVVQLSSEIKAISAPSWGLAGWHGLSLAVKVTLYISYERPKVGRCPEGVLVPNPSVAKLSPSQPDNPQRGSEIALISELS